MKLGFALFNYFPFGGLQRDMLAIAHACVARGHQVSVFCGSWEGERPDFVTIHPVPVRGLTNHQRDAVFAKNLPAAAEREGIETLVGFNKMPGLDVYYAADSCFAAKVYEERGLWYRLLPRARAFLRMERAVFDRAAATRILLISEKEQSVYRRYYETPPERMHLLPPGIRRDRIMPPDYEVRRERFRAEQGWAAAQKILLFVGSGFRTKGLDRAIRALAGVRRDYPGCLLLVLGHDKPGEFAALAERLGVTDAVHFLGGVERVTDYFWGADVLVHPAYRENTGTVLLEAMVAGLPVVTTEACGYAHYASEADMGAVMPRPFRQEALDAALATVLQADARQWRERGRCFADRADIFNMPERVAEWLEDSA